MTEVADRLARLGGVATRQELLAVLTRNELRRAIDGGQIERARRGRYILGPGDAAIRLAHELSATVGLRSAALAHGWKVRTTPSRPELIVPPGRKVAGEKRATFHRSKLAEGDREGPFTTPMRTVIDCARALPLTEALSVADSALRSRTLRASDFLAAAAMVRGAGRTRVLRVLLNASGQAANPFESTLRAIGLGVPGLDLRPQVPLRVAGKRVVPDLVDETLRLVVEADSHEFHTERDQLDSDCWRYDELTLGGWRVFRFSWPQVMHRQAWVTSVLTRAAGAVDLRTYEAAMDAARRA